MAWGDLWGWVRAKVDRTAELLAADQYPHIADDARWICTEADFWTEGFWPGTLWLLASRFPAGGYEALAERWTEALHRRVSDRTTHDLGFLCYPSFVFGYRHTGRQAYRQAALEAAETLLGRMREPGGYMQPWGRQDDPEYAGWAIVDTLMNLPLLWWASRETGEARYAVAAARVAETIRRDHLRPDGSTVHVCIYDPASGRLLGRATHQGRAPESCWSRGQAWAVYGFALAGRETGQERFLEAGRSAARFFLGHLPGDGVPRWDFIVGPADEPTDTSAAAICASGLLELAVQDEEAAAAAWREGGGRLLGTLLAGFRAEEGAPCLLAGGTSSQPHDVGVNRGLIYGDFYLLKTLLRWEQLAGHGMRKGVMVNRECQQTSERVGWWPADWPSGQRPDA